MAPKDTCDKHTTKQSASNEEDAEGVHIYKNTTTTTTRTIKKTQ